MVSYDDIITEWSIIFALENRRATGNIDLDFEYFVWDKGRNFKMLLRPVVIIKFIADLEHQPISNLSLSNLCDNLCAFILWGIIFFYLKNK